MQNSSQKQSDGTLTDQQFRIDTSAKENQYNTVGDEAFDDDWHFNGATITNTGNDGTFTGYLDANAPIVNSYLHGDGFSNTAPIAMGAQASAGNPLTGLIDEVRISNVVRSDAWMDAEYRSQSGSLTTMGPTINRSGLIAEYSHEWINPLADTTGHGYDAVNHNSVAFVSAPTGGGFVFGKTVGAYNRSLETYLDVPAEVVETGESFTFTALVQRDGNPNTGYQTILGSNRFRFQWSTDDRTSTETGRLRLDVTGAGDALSSAGYFELEKWYMAVLRYDAGSNTGDAFLISPYDTVGTPAFTFTPEDPLVDLTALRIGGDGLSGIGSFDGWTGFIDGARFYGSYLDNAQLQEVLESYVPEPSSLLLILVGAISLLFRRGKTR